MWCFCFWQGEQYKLFWPDQPEFVRMAARFGATIVPFAAVGEDDLAEVSLHLSHITFFPTSIYVNFQITRLSINASKQTSKPN